VFKTRNMKVQVFIYLMASVILTSSCATTESISIAMSKCELEKSELSSQYPDTNSNIAVRVDLSNINGLDTIPRSTMLKGFIIPLLFVNFWNYQFINELGGISFYDNLTNNRHYIS